MVWMIAIESADSTLVFMSAKQAKICRVKNGERVNLIALTPDGKRSSRRMDRLKVVILPMADRSLW